MNVQSRLRPLTVEERRVPLRLHSLAQVLNRQPEAAECGMLWQQVIQQEQQHLLQVRCQSISHCLLRMYIFARICTFGETRIALARKILTFFLVNPAPVRKMLTFSSQPYPGENKIQKFSLLGCSSQHTPPPRRGLIKSSWALADR